MGKYIFEFRCDLTCWLIGVSHGTGSPESYWGTLRYWCINFLCFSWMWYRTEEITSDVFAENR